MQGQVVAEPRQRAPLFTPGVLSRLGTRLAVILVYVVAAIPAGLFRGYADNFGLALHAHFNAVEQVVFWDGPTHWLQALFLDVTALRYAAVYIYASWFFLPVFGTMPLIGRSGRQHWRLIGFLVLVYYAGMPFFALYPLQPPWAHDPGVSRVLALVNPGIAGKDDNPFASMPSLHVALPAAAALWFGLRTGAGKALFAYSLLIAVTVVYSGDHYLADILAGYALACVVRVAVERTGLPLLRTEQAPAPIAPAEALDRAA
jgi:hypothetical protein